MAEERRDYAILVSLAMREEAEVMASALRAEGIDAFVGNAHHANVDWGWTLALGGMQVLVPRAKLAEAKETIRERIREAAEAPDPEAEPAKRRDHYKIWLVVAGWAGLWVFVYWSNGVLEEQYRRQRAMLQPAWPALCREEYEPALVDAAGNALPVCPQVYVY